MFVILKTNYFLRWFLCKNDLRISTVGKNIGIIIIKYLENSKETNVFRVIDLKGTVVNRTLPSLHVGSLEITRILPLMFEIYYY